MIFYKYSVLPRLVRMRTIKLTSFLIKKNPIILSNFLRFLAIWAGKTLIWNNCDTALMNYLHLPQSIKKSYKGCTILVEGVRTFREGVLIEEGALTEVVRCVSNLSLSCWHKNLSSFRLVCVTRNSQFFLESSTLLVLSKLRNPDFFFLKIGRFCWQKGVFHVLNINIICFHILIQYIYLIHSNSTRGSS